VSRKNRLKKIFGRATCAGEFPGFSTRFPAIGYLDGLHTSVISSVEIARVSLHWRLSQAMTTRTENFARKIGVRFFWHL